MVDMGNVPGWLALVIAGIAACTSGLALRRAKAVEHRNGFHQDRPTFTAEFEDMGGWHRLVLRLDGPVPVRDRVDVDLLSDGLMFRQSIDGADRDSPYPVKTAWAQAYTEVEGQPRSVAPGGMEVGNTVRWMVERVSDPAPPIATIRVRARDGKRNWAVVLDIEVPVRLQTDKLGSIH